MGHSQMQKTRRKRQRDKKVLAGAAKREKNLRKKGVKVAGADAAKQKSP